MKSRRGSLWGSGNENMIGQYKAGDIVKPVIVNNLGFVGTVRNIDPRINKVWVAWGGGAVSQHDPDEIQLAGVNDPGERAKMASRRAKMASSDFFVDRVSAEANSDARIVSAADMSDGVLRKRAEEAAVRIFGKCWDEVEELARDYALRNSMGASKATVEADFFKAVMGKLASLVSKSRM